MVFLSCRRMPQEAPGALPSRSTGGGLARVSLRLYPRPMRKGSASCRRHVDPGTGIVFAPDAGWL